MANVISVVAGGWSFRDVDQSKVPGKIIGVNDAYLYLDAKLDAVVGMDRLWTEARWTTLRCVQQPAHIRYAALKCINDWERAVADGWLRPFNCNVGSTAFSEDPGTLNGRSSGNCALNLAYIQRPSELYLFGFDMCVSKDGCAHWHPPYPWSKGKQGNTGKHTYEAWAHDFEMYRAHFDRIETKVFNVSTGSIVTAFKRVTPKELGIGK